MKPYIQQSRRRTAKASQSALTGIQALRRHLHPASSQRTKEGQPIAPAVNAPISAPDSAQQIIAMLRDRPAVTPPVDASAPADKPGARSLNELLADGRQRNDEAYCAELRAQGKQIYTPDDVVKLGYKLNPAWTQKDLQARMLCGPVLLPLQTLKKQADKYFQTFVIPGRKTVLAIMAQAYELFCLAMEPTRAVEVFAQVRSEVEKRTKKKLAESVSNGALFVRYVFADFDDRKVHLYSRALEYAYGSNVSVDDFEAWVQERGGWEALRKEANAAQSKSPEVQSAKLAKQEKLKEDEALVEKWQKLRGVIDSVNVSPKLSRALGRQPGRFLVEVTWWPQTVPAQNVYGGHFEVMDVLPFIDDVGAAIKKFRLQEVESSGEALRKDVARMEAARASQAPAK